MTNFAKFSVASIILLCNLATAISQDYISSEDPQRPYSERFCRIICEPPPLRPGCRYRRTLTPSGCLCPTIDCSIIDSSRSIILPRGSREIDFRPSETDISVPVIGRRNYGRFVRRRPEKPTPASGFLPDFLPERGSFPEFLPETGSVPDFRPETGSFPDFLPETGSVPDFRPETGSFPDFLPESSSVPEIHPESGSVPDSGLVTVFPESGFTESEFSRLWFGPDEQGNQNKVPITDQEFESVFYPPETTEPPAEFEPWRAVGSGVSRRSIRPPRPRIAKIFGFTSDTEEFPPSSSIPQPSTPDVQTPPSTQPRVSVVIIPDSAPIRPPSKRFTVFPGTGESRPSVSVQSHGCNCPPAEVMRTGCRYVLMKDYPNDNCACPKLRCRPTEPVDRHEECCEWALAGRCDSDPKWMRPYCERSCGTFGCTIEKSDSCVVSVDRNCHSQNRGRLDVIVEKCLDGWSACDKWAESGRCTIQDDRQFMEAQCPNACGFCVPREISNIFAISTSR